MQTIERRIALFLDFENLVTNTGITAATFDLQPAVDRLLEKGKVIFRRAYADWSRFKDAKGPLHELGVELFDVPPSTRAGKNAADMRLVIDALELCYARDYIDAFVIGSGDSDFCPLAYKLRENNRLVIGLGFKESTSRLFVKACDEFIYLKPRTTTRRKAVEETEPQAKVGRRARQPAAAAPAKVVPPMAAPKASPASVQQTAVNEPRAEGAAPTAKPAAGEGVAEGAAKPENGNHSASRATAVKTEAGASAQKPGAGAAAPGAPANKQGSGASTVAKQEGGGRKSAREKKVPDIAREVVTSLLSRATGPINPSLIKETIVRKEPDFDEREHGFSTFSKMLDAMEKEGLLRRQQMKGRQWYVVPPNDVPEAEPGPDAELDQDGAAPEQQEIPF